MFVEVIVYLLLRIINSVHLIFLRSEFVTQSHITKSFTILTAESCVPWHGVFFFPICLRANVQLIDFDIPWYQARYIWNSEWSYLYSIHLICMAAKSWTEHTARGQGARTTNPPYNNNAPERIYIQLHLVRDTFVSFFSVV